jgi:hypothetical protein
MLSQALVELVELITTLLIKAIISRIRISLRNSFGISIARRFSFAVAL